MSRSLCNRCEIAANSLGARDCYVIATQSLRNRFAITAISLRNYREIVSQSTRNRLLTAMRSRYDHCATTA
jgi:hypothetical protein